MKLPFLPYELQMKIMYEHKGLQHPLAPLVKSYFRDLDEEYSIYKHIVKKIEEWSVKDGKDHILLQRTETFEVTQEPYPRIFFDPGELDFVREKIISHIINE
tara:strand:- start:3024 stop:3329 length:306 start_codon:yes stop_codon:yes gene_type:complete